MFTAGRYIVIDDNRDELRSLVDALHELGAPAIGIHYDALKGVPPNSLIGARVLFIDLHLIDGVQIGNQTKAFDVIVQLLDDGIEPPRVSRRLFGLSYAAMGCSSIVA